MFNTNKTLEHFVVFKCLTCSSVEPVKKEDYYYFLLWLNYTKNSRSECNCNASKSSLDF